MNSIVSKIRRMKNPYFDWYDDHEKEVKQKVIENNSDLVARNVNPLPIITRETHFMNLASLESLPSSSEMWYFHNKQVRMTLAKVEVGMAERFDGKNNGGKSVRPNEKRNGLKPDIYPTYWFENRNQKDMPSNSGLPKNLWVDRTHLLPVGLHGQEDDHRLLVMWSSSQNRKEMRNFEQKVKKLKHPVYWMTMIRREEFGVSWHYRVFDTDDLETPIMKLDLNWEVEKLIWN